MKFTLHFGNNTFPDLPGAIRMVKLAEAAGFDSVITVDHVVFPHKYTSVYPYAPGGRLPGGPGGALPDPLIWMAAMAAVTTKLRFMTGVIILPLRNPFVLAKQVATLDHMSGGRIELGVGVGWLKEEFEAVGVPFEKRGLRTDEYIAVLREKYAAEVFQGADLATINGWVKEKTSGKIGSILDQLDTVHRIPFSMPSSPRYAPHSHAAIAPETLFFIGFTPISP